MCNPYIGEPIYISGNSDPTLNGIWTANPTCGGCTANQLKFPAPSSSVGGNNGTVWSPNYWPIVMPFVVRHGASAIEVYECDLDYAFGLGPNEQDLPTTPWVMDETGNGGCADWGVVGSPLAPFTDVGYENSLSSTLSGQPSANSIQIGASTLLNGSQH